MSPSIPQYSFSNTGAQGNPADFTMPYGTTAASNPGEITASTISSNTSLSGGKLQYTPQQPTQPANQPQPNLNQILGMLQQALIQQGNLPQNPVSTAPTTLPVQLNATPQNPATAATPQSVDIARIYQTLQQTASAGNTDSHGFNQNAVSQSDPNLQQTQNQEMSSLGSLDNVLQNYMGDGGEMVSFESFGSMSGAIGNIEFDPNVAQYETVDESSRMSSSTRTDDETMAAINNLNQS